MSDHYPIRPATEADIPFLATAILAAEGSGTDKVSLATLFDVSLAEANALVIAMLEEGIDGCELSVSSFVVAEHEGAPVATVAGWIEGQPDDMPSGLLKSNLIGFTYPPSGREALVRHKEVIGGMVVPRTAGCLQLEYAFVDDAHRGHGLAVRLFEAHIDPARRRGVPKAQLQVFSNLPHAIASYGRSGFTTAGIFRTEHPDALRFMPWNEKLLMERTLTP